jgi:hypothetical protein
MWTGREDDKGRMESGKGSQGRFQQCKKKRAGKGQVCA